MPRTTILRAPCPVCGRKVKVSDPGSPHTPWAAKHRDKSTGKQCRGSFIAVARPATTTPSVGDQLLKHADDIRVQAHLSLDSDGGFECQAEVDCGAIVIGPEAVSLLASLFAVAAKGGAK